VNEILKALLGNSAALVVFLVSASLLVVSLITIYVVAFIQGRSISFWPPKIGSRPLVQNSSPVLSGSTEKPARVSSESPESTILHSTPAITKGSTIITSSGNRILIESNSYTGVRATLMRARDSTHRQLIVKLFWRGLNPSSTAWAEFSRENEASESLQHRNIVQTLDRGLWNGYPFLVLEYFPGGTLYDVIKNRDRIPGSEILSIAEQVAAGIDYAHTQGRVHRDITPSNILFESDARGRVAISDFGIARILGTLDAHVTNATAGFEGTPAYVAPEFFSSSGITPLVDVYAFGVVLFEMIAGRCPFPEVDSVYALFQQKVNHPVPRLSSFRDVSKDLDERLYATLDPTPARRPRNARAVLSGIEPSLLSL
jgi:serine/threonine protein kinase